MKSIFNDMENLRILFTVKNDSNDIGAIVLSYVDNNPELRGYMFGKEIYDDMVKDGFTQKMLITEDTSMSGCPPGDIVSKITKYNQSA